MLIAIVLASPQGDYLEYALDAQKHNHVHNWGPVDDGTVMILLNGKEIASPNATVWPTACLSRCTLMGMDRVQ